MSENGHPENEARDRDHGVPPPDSAPSARHEEPSDADKRTCKPCNNEDNTPKIFRIAVDRWFELLFTLVIAGATIVNVCVSNRQWSAMREANRITDDNERRSLRAYIISNKTRAVNYGFKEPNGASVWSLWSVVENTGNTPTRNLKVHGMVLHQSKKDFAVMDAYDWKTSRTSFGRAGLIGPKDEIIGLGMGDVDGPTLNQMADWRTPPPHYRVEMAGVITYDDVFGESHWTEFCFAVHVPYADYEHYPAGQAIRSQGDLCPKHNCTDDECEKQ